MNEALPDELRPDRVKVVFEPLKLSRTCLAMVDPGRPDAWQGKAVTGAILKLVSEGVTVVVSRRGMEPIYLLPQGKTADQVRQDVLREVEAQTAVV